MEALFDGCIDLLCMCVCSTLHYPCIQYVVDSCMEALFDGGIDLLCMCVCSTLHYPCIQYVVDSCMEALFDGCMIYSACMYIQLYIIPVYSM